MQSRMTPLEWHHMAGYKDQLQKAEFPYLEGKESALIGAVINSFL